jgi:ankyrin repeat protein
MANTRRKQIERTAKEPRMESGRKNNEPDILRGAAQNNKQEVMASVERDPTSINRQDEKTGMTALHWTCINRNFEIAEYLLSVDRDPQVDALIPDYAQRLPIELAGHNKIVKCLNDWLDRQRGRNISPRLIHPFPSAE